MNVVPETLPRLYALLPLSPTVLGDDAFGRLTAAAMPGGGRIVVEWASHVVHRQGAVTGAH